MCQHLQWRELQARQNVLPLVPLSMCRPSSLTSTCPPNKVNRSPMRWALPSQGLHEWWLHGRKMEWRTDKWWEFLTLGLLLCVTISHKLSSRQKLILPLSKGCNCWLSLPLWHLFSSAYWLNDLWVQAGKSEREAATQEEKFGAKLGRTVKSCWDLRCSSFWKEVGTQREGA